MHGNVERGESVSYPEDEKILILDFGSQYTQLIARRVREQRVYCEIVPFSTPADAIRSARPRGVILSGGPSSVYAEDAPLPDASLFETKIPILGICYGLQVIGHLLDGEVDRAARREYGHAAFTPGCVDEPRGSSHADAAGL